MELQLRFAVPVDVRSPKLTLSRKRHMIVAEFEKADAMDVWPSDLLQPSRRPKVRRLGVWLLHPMWLPPRPP